MEMRHHHGRPCQRGSGALAFALLPGWTALAGLFASSVWGWVTWSEPVGVETANAAGLALLIHGLTVATTVIGAAATLLLLFPGVFPGMLTILLFLAGVVQIFNWQAARALPGAMLYSALAVLCVLAAVTSLLAPGQLSTQAAGKHVR
ncbi:hypothetical protein [Streptomyces sp. BA2]|uniref:hypothetical protein n=1 Tax=Streptomyces sp. BA2 TaxID=436595 RepID=UPI0013272615|nr:hypothetical protein [Streptomyces sp. BA2]MWA07900.1 hypothetical protein [Streptomyces sp. BA2]